MEKIDMEKKQEELGAPAKNNGYRLYYREDGVYLAIDPSAVNQNEMNLHRMIQYIKRKKLENPYFDVISEVVSNIRHAEEKIAETQDEVILDEELCVELSADQMQAYLTLLPPDIGGKKLSREDAKAVLEQKYHVSYGVDEDKLNEIFDRKLYDEKFLIATGREPERGEDGSLEYYFNHKNSGGKITYDEKGRADFKNMLTFEKVTDGQILVKRILATYGMEGTDVCGKNLPAVKGKEAVLPKVGKNVRISKDKTEIFSAIDGEVTIRGGRITVLPNVTIEGDVDMSVGNIEFDGDIVIKGNVNQGFMIKSSGDIIVHGFVEAATLESGGNIIAKGGIKGADRGEATAKGNISALFIERMKITAEGNVTAGTIVNSTVVSEGYVDVSGGRGRLIGGKVSAGKYVVAKRIGSDAGIQTEIHIGMLAQKRRRLEEVEPEINALSTNIGRMNLALNNQNSNIAGKARLELVISLSKMKEEKKRLEQEKAELEELIKEAKDGNVHVLERIYKGVKIFFGKICYIVPYDNEYVTYYKDKKDVLTAACRFIPEK